jgi:hypothetical protein
MEQLDEQAYIAEGDNLTYGNRVEQLQQAIETTKMKQNEELLNKKAYLHMLDRMKAVIFDSKVKFIIYKGHDKKQNQQQQKRSKSTKQAAYFRGGEKESTRNKRANSTRKESIREHHDSKASKYIIILDNFNRPEEEGETNNKPAEEYKEQGGSSGAKIGTNQETGGHQGCCSL